MALPRGINFLKHLEYIKIKNLFNLKEKLTKIHIRNLLDTSP